jgi:hypothetical protein
LGNRGEVMAKTVKIIMDSNQRILLKRYLNKNGKAQSMFTQECAKEMNPYIPYLSGQLKNQDVQINVNSITYSAPYARKQYFSNKGNGINGTSSGGIRGMRWAPRMWVTRGDKIVDKIASLVGGKAE